MKEVESKYEKLRKKHNLPKLQELRKEFGIKLEDPDLILQDIINKMKDELLDRARILESIVFVRTSSNPSSLYEAKMLEEKKDEAFEIFKQLMSIARGAEKIVIAKDNHMISFIKDTHNKWTKKLKINFVEICELLEKKWKNAEIGKNQLTLMYHG